MNKLFAAIGMLMVLASTASALIICYSVPTKGDDEGRMLLGGDSGITVVSYGGDDDGFYRGAGSEITVLSAGADSDGKAISFDAEGEVKVASAGADITPKVSASGADLSPKVAAAGIEDGGAKLMGDNEGKVISASQPIDGN